MIRYVRTALVGATLAFGLMTSSALVTPDVAMAQAPAAQSAERAFKRDDLADQAIKLEAQVKTEAGAVTKPVQTLKTDADNALRRNDARAGLQILGQIAVA